MIRTKVNLTAQNQNIVIIKAVQGENASRKVVINIKDENGNYLNLSDKFSVMYIHKNDGNIVEIVGTPCEDGTEFTLLTQAVSCAGANNAWIEIQDSQNNGILRLNGIVIDVIEFSLDGEITPSETVLTAVQDATINANNATIAANKLNLQVVEVLDNIVEKLNLVDTKMSQLEELKLSIQSTQGTVALLIDNGEELISNVHQVLDQNQLIIGEMETVKLNAQVATTGASQAAGEALSAKEQAIQAKIQLEEWAQEFFADFSVHAQDKQNPHNVSISQTTDYEIGMFNPVLKAVNADPIYTATYAYGYYVRIAGLCYINVVMSVNITDPGSGAASISGLPFVSGYGASQGTNIIRSTGVLVSENPAGGYIVSNKNEIRLTTSNLNSSNTYKAGAGYLGYSGCYKVAN